MSASGGKGVRGGSGVEVVGGIAIDHSKPMLAQVGLLGEHYDAWTHKPLTGAPRYFHSDLLELLTKNPWWVVPLLWVPLCVAMGGCSLWLMGGNLITWAGYFATGVFGWQLIEYSLHRFVFHMAAKSYAFIVFHFAMHGAHHKYPLDKMRLVFPPAPAAIIARIIYFGISSTLNELSTSFAVMSGVVAGYVLYDCAHYWCHHSKNLPAFLEAQKRIHMDHHYRNHLVSFGISSPLYDYLFFTHPHKDGFKK
eukprot:CAMPEP_0177763062 /NCGR_PEP_ID=MMETSP0491_2-20121128/6671_1 /TAXON_ID=63592 /ORGANISM="Tetraselmis chuii, Strain PLY429" /LENGTH=250 /DNA_ID=CAMNT_0019279145 /DNA_START=165 /DNA_END=917 /DNA_ORIENTATION=+